LVSVSLIKIYFLQISLKYLLIDFVVEIVDCLPENCPNKEYDIMQQQFQVQDHSKADVSRAKFIA
jgi:hypothetical protein